MKKLIFQIGVIKLNGKIMAEALTPLKKKAEPKPGAFGQDGRNLTEIE